MKEFPCTCSALDVHFQTKCTGCQINAAVEAELKRAAAVIRAQPEMWDDDTPPRNLGGWEENRGDEYYRLDAEKVAQWLENGAP